MKSVLLFFAIVVNVSLSLAQFNYKVELEQVNHIKTMPALQSCVMAQHHGLWLLMGGRTDGLHKREPFRSFDQAGHNITLYVVDPASGQTWSKGLTGLSVNLLEQLQSTNMEFEQWGDNLYIVGGYGLSPSKNEHTTYPFLTEVNVPGLVKAIQENLDLKPYFKQYQDERFRVCGGYLDRQDNTFYLVGGHSFEGSYNPLGPDHGPGFTQKYTNAIRTFEIKSTPKKLSIRKFKETVDTALLHRRDYNLAPQIYPDGSRGFTAFSGVFQYTKDIPWHDIVDITPGKYSVHPYFKQYLNQYHSAHTMLYDAKTKQMSTIFFGGLSRYYFNQDGVFMDDINVPFVRTISAVSRLANGMVVEHRLSTEMPDLLGTGATFIPMENMINEQEIIQADRLSNTKTHVGYIIGGIRSDAPNVFFSDSLSSDASTKVFKVYLTKTNDNLLSSSDKNPFLLNVDQQAEKLTISFKSFFVSDLKVQILREDGSVAETILEGVLDEGKFKMKYDAHALGQGNFKVRIQNTQGQVSDFGFKL